MATKTPPHAKEDEEWRPHPEYPQLLVSSRGRFYDALTSRYVPVIDECRVQIHRKGPVNLTAGACVLRAFGKESPEGLHFAMRKNRNAAFELENLTWSKRVLGTRKLTDQEVIRIYNEAHRTGRTNDEIGDRYGIHASTVSHLKNGRTWGHITGHPHPDDGADS